MEVANGQQLGFALGEPFLCRRALALGAVAIAATIVADDGVSTRTVLATRDMTSECCRAAALDRTHHLHLVEAYMPRVSQTPSGAVVAEDVRDLQRWPGHPTALRRRSLIRLVLTVPHFPARLRQLRERALDGRDHAGGHARVTCRRLKFRDLICDPFCGRMRCDAKP